VTDDVGRGVKLRYGARSRTPTPPGVSESTTDVGNTYASGTYHTLSMSQEQAEALPEALRDWVDRKAESLDADHEEVLARAVAAYRLVDENHDRLSDAREDDLNDRISTLADRVDDVEIDLEEMIEDVRTRVVQVKRETDGKAAADHEHADLSERLDDQGARTEAVADRLDDLDERVDAGFENFEDVLEYLTDSTDGLESRTATLARAVVDVRSRLAELEAASAEREAAAELKAEANRHGTTAARCGECASPVEIGLLSAPRCPHCGTSLGSFEPAQGFLGSATLVPGRRPALEGRTDPVDSPADLFEAAAGERRETGDGERREAVDGERPEAVDDD
jgi:DNA repair exonuclease SbcCD ATPase subunit